MKLNSRTPNIAAGYRPAHTTERARALAARNTHALCAYYNRRAAHEAANGHPPTGHGLTRRDHLRNAYAARRPVASSH